MRISLTIPERKRISKEYRIDQGQIDWLINHLQGDLFPDFLRLIDVFYNDYLKEYQGRK